MKKLLLIIILASCNCNAQSYKQYLDILTQNSSEELADFFDRYNFRHVKGMYGNGYKNNLGDFIFVRNSNDKESRNEWVCAEIITKRRELVDEYRIYRTNRKEINVDFYNYCADHGGKQFYLINGKKAGLGIEYIEKYKYDTSVDPLFKDYKYQLFFNVLIKSY